MKKRYVFVCCFVLIVAFDIHSSINLCVPGKITVQSSIINKELCNTCLEMQKVLEL